MKNKIIGVLGVLCILFAVITLSAYSTTIKNDSELFGKEIIVLSKDAIEGATLDNSNLILKKVKLKDLPTSYLTEDDISKIKNKVAKIDLYKNEGLSLDRTIDYDDYYPIGSEDIALDVTAIGALSGEIKEGDKVNLWGREEDTSTSELKATLKLEDVKIIAIRDSQNRNIKDIEGGAVPSSVVVRLENKDEIKEARDIKNLFITKYSSEE